MSKPAGKPQTKAFTIKDASLDSIEKFNALKSQIKETPGGTLSHLLQISVNQVNPVAAQSLPNEETGKLEGLQEVNQSLLEQLEAVNQSLQDQVNLNAELTNQLAEAHAKIADLEAREPEKIEVEKPVNVPMSLSGTQAIVEPTETVLQMARKARPFMRKDGLLQQDADQFPNELFNIAVPYYLRHKYDQLF